jgi:hypothetical protein
MYVDETEDPDITPRWWLDRGAFERAAAVLRPGDAVPTSDEEHQVLAAHLAARGLAALHEDGQTWVWTPDQAAELESDAPAATPGHRGVIRVAGELEGDRRAPQRPATRPSRRSRSAR